MYFPSHSSPLSFCPTNAPTPLDKAHPVVLDLVQRLQAVLLSDPPPPTLAAVVQYLQGNGAHHLELVGIEPPPQRLCSPIWSAGHFADLDAGAKAVEVVPRVQSWLAGHGLDSPDGDSSEDSFEIIPMLDMGPGTDLELPSALNFRNCWDPSRREAAFNGSGSSEDSFEIIRTTDLGPGSAFEQTFDVNFRVYWEHLVRTTRPNARWLMIVLYEAADQAATDTAVELAKVPWRNLLEVALEHARDVEIPEGVRERFRIDVDEEERLIAEDPLKHTSLRGLLPEQRVDVLCGFIIDSAVVEAARAASFSGRAILHAFESEPGYALGRLHALSNLFPASAPGKSLQEQSAELFWTCHALNIERGVVDQHGAPIPSGPFLGGVGFGVLKSPSDKASTFTQIQVALVAEATRLNRLNLMFSFELREWHAKTLRWVRRPHQPDEHIKAQEKAQALDAMMKDAFDKFTDSVRTAKSFADLQRAIIVLGKTVALIHPAKDANNRTACDLINFLEVVYLGLTPSYFTNPNDLETRLVEDLLKDREVHRKELNDLLTSNASEFG